MSAENQNQQNENRGIKNTDKYAAVRDPGATPRRDLKNDNVAVVHSSDLDSEPNTEMYEAYEADDGADDDANEESLSKSAAPKKGGKEEVHKTIP